MRERHVRRCRSRERSRDPGDDFERNARRCELLGLLAAASEHVRVAALQTHDALSLAGARDDERMDATFVMAKRSRATADGHELCVARCQREHGVRDELVVGDDLRRLDDAQRAQREEIGASRSGADEPHRANHELASERIGVRRGR
jgi:hypothetical protein